MRITISDAAIEVLHNTLEIEHTIDTRSIASFTVSDRTGVSSYRKGQPVAVYDDAEILIWAGVVNAVDETVVSPTGAKRYPVRCVDWHYLCDKRIARKAYLAQTAGYIVRDLIASYLAAEGVTEGVIDDGPVITEAVLNYVSVTKGLTALREATGFWLMVNPDKSLDFCARATNLAPRTLVATEPREGVQLTHSSPQYRNRQYIKGMRGITDPQTEARKGDGEARAFTVGYKVAKVPTVEVSLDGGAWVEQTRGIKQLESGKQWYWSKGDAVIVQDDGEDVLTAVDRVRITYQGEYDIVALSWDADAIAALAAIEGAGTGYVEDVADEPELGSREAAFQAASTRLARYAVNGRQLRFRTALAGYAPGQLLTVNLPAYGLTNDDLLIEAVTIREEDGYLWYDVMAVEGPETGSWASLFEEALSRGKTLVIRENISEQEILETLEQFPESWPWDEDVIQTVHACPVPADDLYPSSTTFPC